MPYYNSRKPIYMRFWERVKFCEHVIVPCFHCTDMKTIGCLYCCWDWEGIVHPNSGYGTIGIKCHTAQAHRISWELHNKRSFPKGLHCLHKCHRRICVNPWHLSIGTHQMNMRDRDLAGRGTSGDRNPSRIYPWLRQGENNGHSKLNNKDIFMIRALREEGWTYGELSKRFGVQRSAIIKIVQRKMWKHI